MRPEEIRARAWLKALRSGEYPQGRNVMAREKGGRTEYCVLGVLCEVAISLGLNIRREVAWLESNRARLFTYNDKTSYPGEDIYLFFGMATGAGSTLSRLNDLSFLSFAAIADHVEANLPKYFTWA